MVVVLPASMCAIIPKFLVWNSLTKYPANAKILLKAPATSSQPGAVLAAAFEFGKGRVVYVSDHVFLRPGNLERGDNARFLANTLAWLGKKEPDHSKIQSSLFLTSARLKEAEDKEKNIHPMKFPADTPTYLNRSELPKGLAGGDPVLDALRAL